MNNGTITNPSESDLPTMPAVFIGHGSPMNTLEHNRYTQAWNKFGQSIPKPRAILAISAHWYINGTAVTAMPRPRTIHDFGGFPDELFAFQYPAVGDAELAVRVADIAKPTNVALDSKTWGLDHGTWSVLAHMFPDADVPVIQLSLDSNMSFEQHVRLGAALAPLRKEGVLIFASGNVVHNLRRIEWNNPDGGADWNRSFDDEATALMTRDPDRIPSLEAHRHYQLAAPTPEHLIPLFHIAGLAAAASVTAEVLISGSAMGSLTMTSYVVNGA